MRARFAAVGSGMGHCNSNYSRISLVAALLAAASLSPASALAAAADNGAQRDSARPDDNVDQDDDDVIVVTAERRAQNLQDVPVAVTAFTQDMMEARGIDRAEDLLNFVPGLTFSSVNREQGSNASIRGVGLVNDTIGGDPGVTLYMDGHYLASPGFLLVDYLDVERVEVQRGPQGTLYGRNSMGGNINIITARPTEEFHAQLSAQVGNYDNRLLKGMVSGAIVDGVRVRLAAADGHTASYVTYDSGTDAPMDYTSLRGTVDIDLASNLEVRGSGYWYKSSGFLWLAATAPYPAVLTTDPTHQPGQAPLTNDGRFSKARGGSFDIIWRLGDYEIRSLTAYNNSDFAQEALGLTQYGGAETWGQEFQIISPSDRPLRWIAGLFLYDEDTYFDFRLNNAPALILRSGPHTATASSVAVYLDGQYSISDNFEIFAGGRYTHDKKGINRRLLELNQNGVQILPGGQDTPLHSSWSQWTYRAGANYRINDDVMLYLSYSKGYKAGGFNGSSVNTPAYNPEYVNALEGGLKSDLFDRVLQLNLTGFHYSYKDKQEVVLVNVAAGANYITNAASAKISGLEIETVLRLAPGLTLNGTLSYLNAEYDKFTATDSANTAAGPQNLHGNRLLHSPEFKFTLGGQYVFDLGGAGKVTLRADYAWIDDIDYSIFNKIEFRGRSYDQINANIRWDLAGDRWSIEAFVKNAADDLSVTNVFSLFGQVGYFYGPPRTYGAKVRYTY